LGSSVFEITGVAGAGILSTLLKESIPQPVTKYCVIIVMTFDTTQYKATPLENVIVRKANINGISHVSILFMDCCLGSDVGIIDIFCWIHIVAAVNIAIM